MNIYVVLALFLLSSTVILACLDHLKMRLAMSFFWALCVVLILFVPIAIWGGDITEFCTLHQGDNAVVSALAFAGTTINLSNLAFGFATLLLSVIAVISVISTVIVVVQTAKVICKFVKKLQQKQKPQIPQKQNYQRKLVRTKIFYKCILYLRLCRLNS